MDEGLINVYDFERAAESCLPRMAWDYFASGAQDEITLRENHAAYATSLNNLGALYRERGEYDRAEELLRRALAIDQAALGPQHPTCVAELANLALLYGFNRYEALRSFRKASELDPAAAMPYWGMAMSTGPYINMGVEGDGDLFEVVLRGHQVLPGDRRRVVRAGRRDRDHASEQHRRHQP